MRNVICMKWGTLYGPEYANRLYAMVRTHLDGPLRFVCLTDDPSGLREEIEYHGCPVLDLPMPHRMRGWRKISLFSAAEDLFGLEGDWLYLDLDVVVTGTLEGFFTYRPELPFVVMRNWTQPRKRIGNTSCYRFRVGESRYIRDRLLEDPVPLIRKYRNSQTYISNTIDDLQFWPEPWCALFKVHCVPPWPMRFWKEPLPPSGARVVAFPGSPNPHEAVAGLWPEKRIYKRIYKYIRPARWIEEAWQAAERAAASADR